MELNLAERMAMTEGLRELGLEPAESQANFVWFDLPEAVDERETVRGLAERQVLVRAGTPLGREGALRVTIGRPGENQRFLTALPSKFDTARGMPRLHAVVIDVDSESGRARGIDRLSLTPEDVEALA